MSSRIKLTITLCDRQGQTPGQVADHIQKAIEQYELIDSQERFTINSMMSSDMKDEARIDEQYEEELAKLEKSEGS